MKEFMTEVSEYAGENEEESRKDGNIMIFCVLGTVVLAVCILCLLTLWQKIANRGKTILKSETFTETAGTSFDNAPVDNLSELQKSVSEDANNAPVPEYTQEETIRQQYLTDTEYLRNRVESLMQSMAKTKEALEEALRAQEDNAAFKEQIGEITNAIVELAIEMQNTKERINELEELINVMNNETVLTIQEDIAEIEGQIIAIDSDVSEIYIRIDALKLKDSELQKKIDEIENNMKTYAEQSATDVTNKFDSISDKMQQMEGNTQTMIQQLEGDTQTKIENLQTLISNMLTGLQQIESQSLRYSYDAASNTLYLYSE